MSKKYERPKRILKELFKLDQPDLDFVLRRVMGAQCAEGWKFFDSGPLKQVQARRALDALSQLR